MKKIVKGPRKPPKRAEEPRHVIAMVELCPCNIGNYSEWVDHNLEALAHMYTVQVITHLMHGGDLPPDEEFDRFCFALHTKCQQALADATSTPSTLH